ncbi:MAG: phospholipase D family protein [Bacillota bacterium]|nr:phospholipase D family protein [Bacillota bacterium]
MFGWIVLVILLSALYGRYKALPKGISFESPWVYAEEVHFVYDLTYRKNDKQIMEQAIFDRIWQIIDEAEEFLVIDMFLLNDDYNRAFSFPSLSNEFSEKLVEKKNNNPEMPIYVIVDEINTFYGVYESRIIQILKEAGIPVVTTNLDKLRNSNILYSSIYDIVFKWFKTSGKGWIRNPFTSKLPYVTVRAYLKLMNFKANHRKTVISEKEVMVGSANPHDASFNNSNIAFAIKGAIVDELLESELAVMAFSGYDVELPLKKNQGIVDYKVKLITEGKICENLKSAIDKTKKGDCIRIAMFYLSEHSIINALIKASKRDVDIKMILDVNQTAFGIEKIGVPNKPAASELIRKSKGNVNIKWYETNGEQFHTKLIMINYEENEKVLLIGGSANLTRRNIRDFNLETDVCIEASIESRLANDTDTYFNRIWNNEEGNYTVDYSVFQEDALWKKIVYYIQEYTGLSTF